MNREATPSTLAALVAKAARVTAMRGILMALSGTAGIQS